MIDYWKTIFVPYFCQLIFDEELQIPNHKLFWGCTGFDSNPDSYRDFVGISMQCVG